MIYEIANATQLKTALASAVGGDTLRLAAGNYGTYKIDEKRFDSAVRIESADAANPAQFDGLTIEDSSNIVLAGLNLGRGLNEGEPSFTTLNTIRRSDNIVLKEVRVHGSMDDNPQNDGRGLIAADVNNLLIEDSVFTELLRGVIVSGGNNVVIRDTDFRTIRTDGINIIATHGLVISNNDFTDFRPIYPDHGDAIQFFNTGASRGSKDITIEDNRILVNGFETTSNTGTQGIFISDPLEFGYENILIRNNLVYGNSAFHGITIDGGNRVQITGNTVTSRSTDGNNMWIRVVDGDGIVVDNNIADTITLLNVTRLFQGENTNLNLFPDLRALFPNIDNPTSAADLIAPELGGYVGAVAPTASPVSGALASALSGSIEPSQSQQAFKPIPVLDEAEEAPSFAAIFAATPVPEASVPVMSNLYATSEMPVWSFKDLIAGHHFAIA